MPKEEIIGIVLEMYDARKEAKEYLDFYANPDEDGKLEEYKKIITEEFYPSRGRQEPKTRFSVCRKAVSDYKKIEAFSRQIGRLDALLYGECLSVYIRLWRYVGAVLYLSGE